MVIDTQFQIPADFDFDTFIGDRFGVFRDHKTCNVRVRFTGICATYARERRWHPEQKTTYEHDDTIVEFQTNHIQEAMRWILSWGSCARVEGDSLFLDMIKKELQNMSHNYGL